MTGAASFNLTYPAVTNAQGVPDKSHATLTHRIHLDDVPKVLASSAWDYTKSSPTAMNGTAIKLNASPDAAPCDNSTPPKCPFVANDIYEFMYTAKNPTVNTIGLAAIRDFNAWLRYETTDSAGNANPLAGDVRRIYTEVVSQPGRTLNDFTHLGFNQAENGKIVFDGMLQWIAAGDGLSMNFRFSQPGRTERNRQEHLFNEATFPFANVMTTDPFTGIRDSRFARCEMSHTCPVAMEMGEGRIALAHDSRREEGPARLPVRSQLLHLQSPARDRERDLERQLPAIPEPAQLGSGPACALDRDGRMGHRAQGAAGEQGPDLP